jgi:eukaryotic-like serine/threonine-protein kinase
MAESGDILEGKYRIVRMIGEGGMGAVFEGENMAIHRRVAIKVLHPAASGNADAVMRFEREAQAAGRIGSDHILEVLDLGRMPDGARYMVMEFLDGEPLSQRIRGLGRMRPEQIVPLAQQILIGLGAAHAASIVHRDLKPDNIFILKEKAGRRDFVKLIDFGISKFNALSGDMSMTRTGAVMGTPYYMSPEQAKGSGVVDHRSDLYAVGVILYEAATGQVPFEASTFNELLFKIVLSTPPPLRDVVPDIDPRFAAVVEKAMAREPNDRFASASDMLAALGEVLAGGVASGAALGATVEPKQLATSTLVAPVTAAQTQGGFSASQLDRPAAAPAKKAPVGIIAGAATLLLVGVAFGAYKLVATGSDGAAASSGAAERPKPPEQGPTPIAPEAAPPPPVPAAPSAIATAAAPSPNASAEAKPDKAAARAPIPGRPAALPAATPAGAPAAAAAPASKKRDFGY